MIPGRSMFRTLVETAQIEVEGRSYAAHYFEHRTARGGRRFSCEVVLDGGDRIILDGDSLPGLQTRLTRLAPATIYSRVLAAKGSSVAA